MRLRELAERAAGKSPRYVLRRAIREGASRMRAGAARRRIERVTADEISRSAGGAPLSRIWQDARNSAFAPSPESLSAIRDRYRNGVSDPLPLRAACEKILAHEFDLLGSGPVRLGSQIDWHRDFKSGRRWELRPSGTIDSADLRRDSDVKVPWELSRGQHLTAIGRLWVIDRDLRAPAEFEAEVRDWIASNPVGLGVNWACTMDVALRAISWIWALALFDGAPLGGDFRESILLSLYRHGIWIASHLELGEVNGNHYLSDALGLVACGAVFRATPEGRAWLESGAKILEDEILLQVGEDGVDFEGSVPYHRLALEIFLVASRFLESAGLGHSSGYRRRLEKMLEFVHAYVTPDGLSPVVGDADDGRALILGETEIRDHRYLLSTGAALFGRGDFKARAGRIWEDTVWLLGAEAAARFDALETREDDDSRVFPDSGFCVLRTPEQYLFADVGPVGFRGRGGHGHNDCLSFEWHAFGRPLLTDSGAYVYTPSVEWRNRFRSTEFHNTIRVDREEINRLPSASALWTLRDDARPSPARLDRQSDLVSLSGGHSGYFRLAEPVGVFRTFELERGASRLRLIDRLEGRGEHVVEFFFHARPGAKADAVSEETAGFSWEDGTRITITRVAGPAAAWEERSGWFSPSYGVKIERPIWVAIVRVSLPCELRWELGYHPRPGR